MLANPYPNQPGAMLGRGRKNGTRDLLSHFLYSQPWTSTGPLSTGELSMVQKVLASNRQQGAVLSPFALNFLESPM